MSSQTTQKRLALAVIDFLRTSLKDGTVSSDDAESLEVAQQCIADSFGVDTSDTTAMKEALGGQSLLQIYGVYEKLRGGSSGGAAGGTAGTASAGTTGPSATGGAAASPPNLEAESFKSQGNSAMQARDYASAIEAYTKALNLSPLNAIYLSNRAAAYSASGKHAQASTDAEQAVAVDPGYTKAWSRLGLARFALGDARGSMEAYSKGIEYEGSGGSAAMKKGFETAKRKVEQEDEEDEGGERMEEDDVARGAGDAPGMGGAGGMPDLSSLAGMFGGGGRGGGGGGMPDLGGLMNNPMFANMAQNLMSNPDMMNNIMGNPRLREMAESFGGRGGGAAGGGGGGAGAGAGRGGMPDISSLMSDPSIAEMARNLMGGAGGAGGAGRGRGAGGGGA